MRTFEEHFAAVRDTVGARETVSLPLLDAAALHAPVAEDVVARFDSPRFDNSQMDGYALPHSEGGTFQVGPTIAAGSDAATIYPDGIGESAAPIMTGAPLPTGASCVVPVEKCSPAQFAAEGEEISAPACAPGQFIRRAGSDARRGERLIPRGTPVDPLVVATLASQDVDSVRVERPSRILVVTGGKEIGTHIPDANGPMLKALARRYGIEVASALRTDDDPAALEKSLTHAIGEHAPDAVVTSGGISHGKFEVVRQILEPHGWFGHVAQQPGGPQGLATFHGVPFLCLPGNPISTLVSFRLYAAPALGCAPRPLRTRLASPAAALPDKDRFYRGVFRDDAAVIGGAGSHLISQAVGANCLIRVPAGVGADEGADVVVYPL